MTISRILFLLAQNDDYLSRAIVANRLERFSSANKSRGTILHRRKYLAVSAGLNRIVSVRNSWFAPDGRYPLRLSAYADPVFGLSSIKLALYSNHLSRQKHLTT